MAKVESPKLLKVLEGKVETPPPIWLMRQAGRYLPEYRALRAKAGSFWTMCMTPELASEITLQPLSRFELDAAILFSDILVVPFALGSEVRFEEGNGPKLSRSDSATVLEADPACWRTRLAPSYEALAMVRAKLDPGKALLGFAGAPWTLASYMAEGGGSPDQRAAKLWGYRDPTGFAEFLSRIGDCVAEHLIAQIDAGADAVQIFDSWASGLTESCFADWVVGPTRRVVDLVRARQPKARIIGFPRAATLEGYARYARGTGVDGVSLDTSMPLKWAVETMGGQLALQGILDPIVLIAGGAALEKAVDHILAATKSVPFIFNLGHGVLPETPIEHVAAVVERVRAAR